jgi:hypothetical protein
MKRLAICALLVAASSQAGAQDNPVLEPSSAWLLDYGEESCSLLRTFGTGDAMTRVLLTSYGSWVGQRLVVVGAAVPRSSAAIGNVHYTLLPEGIQRDGRALLGRSGDSPAVSFGVRIAPFDPDRTDEEEDVTSSEWQERAAEPDGPVPSFEAAVEGLRVVFDDHSTADFHLGSMGKPLEALRTCVDDLLASWGLDPVEQKARTRNATPDESTVARVQRRYPSDMLRSGTGAYVPVRVMVDAEGQATSCVIQEQGIDQAFADATCDGLRRIYRPALDAEGQPIDSVFQTAVVYMIGR